MRPNRSISLWLIDYFDLSFKKNFVLQGYIKFYLNSIFHNVIYKGYLYTLNLNKIDQVSIHKKADIK